MTESLSDSLRLNKALADAGLCSRRKADELVFSGAVTVNGVVAASPGERVNPQSDTVCVHGKPVPLRAPSTAPCWLMLHKPVSVVSTVSDPEGRPTVLGLVPEQWRGRRLYPVGRLDFFSEGLLLLSDDGDLAHRLTHPRWHMPRVYHVLVRPEGPNVPSKTLELFRKGMRLAEGDQLAPVPTKVLPTQASAGILLEMTLHQGVNRQIRRMCRDAALTILRLKRMQQGPLYLGDLPPGQLRPLSQAELHALRSAVGLAH